ncbi:hypothetical protein CC1G_08051 [Coprinopsis cinerea okayama7|uniref:Phosphatidylglycerol/phosphatidylinositol transfer protein n=1 Tax=Coprinopsis cinerea (strain Okayama-7 / 130 / ATCC MYA-4618 / FGSC 9003) TaxID=240176 RepID=A8NQF1_COPC7|nr:hypothetical protein CC1G_08051 [Coprinopsis cinerea okayama7\|eukprot:XP_001835542.1 hypothetical protein CC1G_08051 [Coprinopsis cinerea okayama7\
MLLNLSTFLVPFFFIVGALAQASVIQLPTPGARIRNGQTFTVQIAKPMSHQGSREAGFVIGLLPCTSGSCPGPAVEVGRLLYNGPYTPQLHEQPGRPYQNFTFTMPPADEMPKGFAQLSTIRLHLFGAAAYPILELNNITIRVI